MNRSELKEVIIRVIDKLNETDGDAPIPACLFDDAPPCDATTKYNIGEEG